MVVRRVGRRVVQDLGHGEVVHAVHVREVRLVCELYHSGATVVLRRRLREENQRRGMTEGCLSDAPYDGNPFAESLLRQLDGVRQAACFELAVAQLGLRSVLSRGLDVEAAKAVATGRAGRLNASPLWSTGGMAGRSLGGGRLRPILGPRVPPWPPWSSKPNSYSACSATW